MAYSPAQTRLWSAAQWTAAAALAVTTIGLFQLPEPTMSIFWNVLVPVLPASFLVAPALWRAVCPLATLNMLAGPGTPEKPALSAGALRMSGTLGIVLLVVLIPTRRVLLNLDATVLGVVFIALAVVAVVAGMLFRTKAGFCNAFCPVLPVEKLYGQNPLWKIENPRCVPCDACTSRGCLDLTNRAAILETRSSTGHWTTTVFGGFSAAFPGIVLGYFLISDGDAPATVYGSVAGYGLASWLAVSAISRLGRLDSSRLLPVLAAAALGLYYGFAAPSIAEGVGLGVTTSWAIRIAAWGLTGYWLARAVRVGKSKSG